MQQELGQRPLALILSGGAALGSWQGGVLCNLEAEYGLDFHSVLGTSAGSLNGVAYFQRNSQLLREVWRDVGGAGFMRWRPRLRPPSLYSQEALRKFLTPFVDEERCRRERRCWFYAVAADIGGSGVLQAEYSPEEGGPWTGSVLDHVLGSIAVPFLFPPVEIPAQDGAPQRTLVDGHLTSFIDLERLIARGVRDFLFVNVVSSEGRSGPLGNWRGFISRLINHMLVGQVSNSLASIRGRVEELGIRAYEFTPRKPLKIGVFAFNAEECRKGFDQGVQESRILMDNLQDFRII
jgi:predicted acylesterase/phospholipase RssA